MLLNNILNYINGFIINCFKISRSRNNFTVSKLKLRHIKSSYNAVLSCRRIILKYGSNFKFADFFNVKFFLTWKITALDLHFLTAVNRITKTQRNGNGVTYFPVKLIQINKLLLNSNFSAVLGQLTLIITDYHLLEVNRVTAVNLTCSGTWGAFLLKLIWWWKQFAFNADSTQSVILFQLLKLFGIHIKNNILVTHLHICNSAIKIQKGCHGYKYGSNHCNRNNDTKCCNNWSSLVFLKMTKG